MHAATHHIIIDTNCVGVNTATYKNIGLVLGRVVQVLFVFYPTPKHTHTHTPGESVFARCLSSLKDERVEASKHLTGPSVTTHSGDKKEFIEHIRKALYASKIVSYAQGFMLMREAAKVYNWKLNYGGIALMWRGGCIIRRCI